VEKHFGLKQESPGEFGRFTNTIIDDWEPGYEGKGIMYMDGAHPQDFFLWKTKDERPHHYDADEEMAHMDKNKARPLYIERDGEVSGADLQHDKVLKQIHPDLYVPGAEFGKFTSTKHRLDWQPGGKGKGWVFDDGTVWTWPVSEAEGMVPYHMEMKAKAAAQGLKPMEVRDESNPTPSMPEGGWLRSTGAFYVDEQGKIIGVPEIIAHHARKADPRLDSKDGQWKFQ
jgi:hypothetical protein